MKPRITISLVSLAILCLLLVFKTKTTLLILAFTSGSMGLIMGALILFSLFDTNDWKKWKFWDHSGF